MAPLSFTQALIQAEAQARSTLAPELHERLSAAVSLVTAGRVFQATDGTWQVDSASTQGLTYTVNGTCPCDDVHYNKPPQGLCKHRLSVYLARRVFQLMEAPAPAPPSTPVETERGPQPLPEAPASANCHITIAGRQVQLTLRDVDEARLLQRLAVVLEQYPMPQPAPPAASQPQGQGKEWCSKHAVAMKENHKDGRTWWSHQTAEGWCKGK